uniref:NB-ARC domain-containing protein n=1 Tax=Oryza punctata TaxID=4537 RepID=A0A0E0JUQ8_ORYPU
MGMGRTRMVEVGGGQRSYRIMCASFNASITIAKRVLLCGSQLGRLACCILLVHREKDGVVGCHCSRGCSRILVQSILGNFFTGQMQVWIREVGLAKEVEELEIEMRSVQMVLAAAERSKIDPLSGSLGELKDLLCKPVQGVLNLEMLRHIAMPNKSQSGPRKQRQTTSLPIEHKVYGRDADRENIIELLTKGKSSDLSILPIVGIGGVGETTLAREELVHAWISQNFVKCEYHTERLEETGKQYLDSLVDWGFFEEVESHYVMHDLMHDLAEKVSQNECATIDGLESKKISQGVQHLSIITTAYDKKNYSKFPCEKFENHLIAHEKVHSGIAGVGNLTSLQELTFMVQDANNFNIGQLQSMNEIQRLQIFRLENVKTKEEAKSARLIDKEHLKELSLSWDDNSMSTELTAEKTRDNVLESLEPHQNLKHLQLAGYGGGTSPTWLANKVTSLQTLHLENCREWQNFQSLQMLPVLRKLKLIRMWNLMEVSIPSYLEELVLVNMPKMEKIAWKILPLEEARALKELELMAMPLVEELSVPSLEKLVLIDMPSLQSCSGITASPLQLPTSQIDQMEWISSIRELIIRDCSSLVVSLPVPPSPLISYLSIKGLPTFPRMEIHQGRLAIESNELTELDGKILPFHNLKGITSMWVQHCPNLISISSEVFSQLIGLEDLVIRMCPKLLQQHISFEAIEENGTSTTDIPVLPSLKSLTISSCGITGRWLSKMLPHLKSLQDLDLDLHDCPQIVISINQPTETSSLDSEETTSARDEHLLQIPCNLLHSLKGLRIRGCPDLEFSAGVNGGFEGCTSLVRLNIIELSIHIPANLQSYSPKGLPNLKKLDLWDSHLKSVQLKHLSSLQSLYIRMNPELSDACDLKPQEQEQSGDQVGLVLPLSLVEFSISNFERGHSSFTYLPSIKKLELWGNPELVSVQLGYCTALEELQIAGCTWFKFLAVCHLHNFIWLCCSRSPDVRMSMQQRSTAPALLPSIQLLSLTAAEVTLRHCMLITYSLFSSASYHLTRKRNQGSDLTILSSNLDRYSYRQQNLEVASAAVEWVVQSILGSFFTGHLQVWIHEVGLTEVVQGLESAMRSMQMVLATIDRRKIDNGPLSESLNELKDLLFDAEDVMDELDYYQLQQQIEGKGSRASACIDPEGSCVSSYTPSFFQQVSSSMNQIIGWAMHGRKRKREEEPTHNIILPLEIKRDLTERIKGILNQLRIKGEPVLEVLQLELSCQIAMSKQIQSEPRKPRQTTSLLIERKVYGRDAERDNIIELLTKGKSSDLGVLPLVGVGGVGKTTLARFVYHDQRIKDHFDLRMWVCVSDNFNEKSLTREILEHETLLENIRRKRFLLVLDDMWEDGDMSGWDNLLVPFKCNEATGCMILVTTRRTSVAKRIGTVNKVEVNGLDETEFWLLFKAWAFNGYENLEHDPNFQSTGKDIARELKGNPLAARSVGALLNRSVSSEHWKKVQYKWKSLVGQDDDILSILMISYEYLPVHLQHCFSYCSLFPKDHKFNGKKLVHAWISQDFVKCECRTERLEETGMQYLDNLVDWGFFEEVESHYVMHDLMHDLAEKVSSNECAAIDGLESNKISPSVRHLSIITTAYDKDGPHSFPTKNFENKLQNIRSLQKLRTLMFFGRRSTMLLRSLQTLCKELKRLRLLRIYVTISDISSTHNFLKPHHLRYLEFIVVPATNMFGHIDIANTSIPQAFTNFFHLQVLDISSNGNIAVPIGMNKLINLRHLIAHEKVHSAIDSVGKLTCLQKLIFKVQNADNFEIGQLQAMNDLVILGISQLENVKTKKEAISARLMDKEHLEELSLSWNDNMSSGLTEENTRYDVLEGLEPHENLKHLQLTGYSGATSPTWFASKVTSLQVLHLENCREWQTVQYLEMLPLLRKLKLIRMWNLMEVSIPSYLEELVLVNMPKLENCVGTYGIELTSRLRVLMVKDCPQLNEFVLFHRDHFHAEQKSWFPSLNKLTIGHCYRIIMWKILPLEEMRALKDLELMDVPIVEELSVPSLEKLVLIQMRSLQICSGITASPPVQVSTSQVDQNEWISSLRELTIHDCSSLVVSLPIPPSPVMSYLSIKKLSAFPTMEINNRKFTIESDELSELDGRILPFHNLKGVTSMYLQRCPNLTRISTECFNQLISLECLVIHKCPNLLQLQISDQANNTNIPALPSLKSLTISSCGIAGRWLTQMLQHVKSLAKLELLDCPQIKFLLTNQPTEREVTSSLASAGNEQLLQIPCGLFYSLKRLSLSECPNLEFWGGSGGFAGYTSLVQLQIKNCPKLVSALVSETNDNGLLPVSLQDLSLSPISENLQSFSPEGLPCLRSLSPYLQQESSGKWYRLESLMVDDAAVLSVHLCKQLTSLRILQFWSMGMVSLTEEQERALQLLTSLRQIGFSRCQKLESLPANLQSLDFLEVLRIDECRSIRRLPEMGLPPSLNYLDLHGCCEELCMQCRIAETEKLKVEIIYKQ